MDYCLSRHEGYQCTRVLGHPKQHEAGGSNPLVEWPNADEKFYRPIHAPVLDAKSRKTYPMFSGLLKYFPDALMEVAHVSFVGNEQHNPGQLLHWDRSKSTDEPDALLRHLKDAGTLDTDGIRHSAKVAWRALAMLQKELEAHKSVLAYKGDDPNRENNFRPCIHVPAGLWKGECRLCYPPEVPAPTDDDIPF